jgi:hydrogenase-4 component E
MTSNLDLPLVLVLLLNFFALGTHRLKALIFIVGLQGAILGCLPPLVHHDARVFPLMAVTVILRGIVLPKMLLYAQRNVVIRREVDPLIGTIASVLLGALGTGMALAFATTLPLSHDHAGLVVPASLATVFSGFLILITRRKAITLVLGYLMLENGIFIFGLLLLDAMPLLVEVGVLLDLFVGVFVMGIIIQHVSRSFDSESDDYLTALKE